MTPPDQASAPRCPGYRPLRSADPTFVWPPLPSPEAAQRLAMLQQLDLSGATIHAVDADTIRIDGLNYGGTGFDLNLTINLDGTWGL